MKYFARIAQILAFLLVLPITVSAVDFQEFPKNPEVQKIFAQIPGGAIGKIRLLNNNDEAWYARWHLIESARVSIDATYFILQNDIFGFSFLGLLKRKAEQGVKIRLMIDARMIPAYFRPLGIDEFQDLVQNPNVQIRFYNSIPNSLGKFLKTADLRFLQLSNHDKILIVDGKISVTGGRNIGADYFVQPGECAIVYYDSDVVLEGNVLANELLAAFEDEWKVLGNKVIKADRINLQDQRWKLEMARRAMQRYMIGDGVFDADHPRLSKRYQKLISHFNEELKKFKNISSYSGFRLWRGERAQPIKILDKHSLLGHKDQIAFNLKRFIEGAKHEIVFQNPYVVLTKEAWDQLAKASKRGVKIVLHTNGPKSIDVPEALAFFCNEWADMMRDMPTLRIFMAPDELHQLHSKAIVVDGQIALVGTYNLDPLSMVINSEEMAVINNPEFAAMVRMRVLRATQTAIECKIRRESNGKVVRVRGPEQYATPAALRKMNLLVKLKWLRPLL